MPLAKITSSAQNVVVNDAYVKSFYESEVRAQRSDLREKLTLSQIPELRARLENVITSEIIDKGWQHMIQQVEARRKAFEKLSPDDKEDYRKSARAYDVERYARKIVKNNREIYIKKEELWKKLHAAIGRIDKFVSQQDVLAQRQKAFRKQQDKELLQQQQEAEKKKEEERIAQEKAEKKRLIREKREQEQRSREMAQKKRLKKEKAEKEEKEERLKKEKAARSKKKGGIIVISLVVATAISLSIYYFVRNVMRSKIKGGSQKRKGPKNDKKTAVKK